MIDLRHRDTSLFELMEDLVCDTVLLEPTYAQYAVVNRSVSGWRRPYVVTPTRAGRGLEPDAAGVGFGGDIHATSAGGRNKTALTSP